MSSKPDLLVAPCSYDAAKYAVMRWHYSRTMPRGNLVKFGAWEYGAFKGVLLYGHGATPEIGKEFGLTKFQMCELVRIALGKHDFPVSMFIGRAMKELAQLSPELRMVVSFADTAQGHTGAIYQASNWIYTGAMEYHAYKVNGVVVHPRTLGSKYGAGGQSIPWLRNNIDPNAERITTAAKHRYLYPLDKAMRKQIAPLAQPYPKKDMRPVNGDNIAASDAGRFDSEPGAL